MSEKREIISCIIPGLRAVGIRRLWTPETTDFKTQKPLDKPRYSVTGILPKTKAKWFEEPALESVVAAARKLYQQHYSGYPLDALIWPVKDGDKPNQEGKISDWAKNHWFIRADTTSPDYLTIEYVQNGKPGPLAAASMGGRRIVKDGDFFVMAVGIAKTGGTAPGFKTYLNGVMFTGVPGDEIKMGSGVSGETMLAAAKAQGIPVAMGSGAPTWNPNAGQPTGDTPF